MAGCFMLDFSVYKPPAELRLNHTTGGENAKKWDVSASRLLRALHSYSAGRLIGAGRVGPLLLGVNGALRSQLLIGACDGTCTAASASNCCNTRRGRGLAPAGVAAQQLKSSAAPHVLPTIAGAVVARLRVMMHVDARAAIARIWARDGAMAAAAARQCARRRSPRFCSRALASTAAACGCASAHRSVTPQLPTPIDRSTHTLIHTQTNTITITIKHTSATSRRTRSSSSRSSPSRASTSTARSCRPRSTPRSPTSPRPT